MKQPNLWIEFERLLERWNVTASELRKLIDNGIIEIDEYVDYEKKMGVFSPQLIKSLEVERDIFDDERLFKLSDILTVEEIYPKLKSIADNMGMGLDAFQNQSNIKKETLLDRSTGAYREQDEETPSVEPWKRGGDAMKAQKEERIKCLCDKVLKHTPVSRVVTLSKKQWEGALTACNNGVLFSDWKTRNSYKKAIESRLKITIDIVKR